MAKMKIQIERSGCPIATTLDVVGDKWTLVIVRDMLTGKKRYSDFLESPERITTNILANRLAAMVASGIVEKSPYQLRPKRFEYSLTKSGRELLPVLQEVCKWANRNVPGTWVPPAAFMAMKP